MQQLLEESVTILKDYLHRKEEWHIGRSTPYPSPSLRALLMKEEHDLHILRQQLRDSLLKVAVVLARHVQKTLIRKLRDGADCVVLLKERRERHAQKLLKRAEALRQQINDEEETFRCLQKDFDEVCQNYPNLVYATSLRQFQTEHLKLLRSHQSSLENSNDFMLESLEVLADEQKLYPEVEWFTDLLTSDSGDDVGRVKEDLRRCGVDKVGVEVERSVEEWGDGVVSRLLQDAMHGIVEEYAKNYIDKQVKKYSICI